MSVLTVLCMRCFACMFCHSNDNRWLFPCFLYKRFQAKSTCEYDFLVLFYMYYYRLQELKIYIWFWLVFLIWYILLLTTCFRYRKIQFRKMFSQVHFWTHQLNCHKYSVKYEICRERHDVRSLQVCQCKNNLKWKFRYY